MTTLLLPIMPPRILLILPPFLGCYILHQTNHHHYHPLNKNYSNFITEWVTYLCLHCNNLLEKAFLVPILLPLVNVRIRYVAPAFMGNSIVPPTTPLSTLGMIDASHLQPGDWVSGDQVESTTPGLIPEYHGTPSTAGNHAGIIESSNVILPIMAFSPPSPFVQVAFNKNSL